MEAVINLTRSEKVDKKTTSPRWVVGFIIAFGIGGASVLFYPYFLLLVPLALLFIVLKEIGKYLTYTKTIDLHTNKYASSLEDIHNTGY